MTDFNVNQLSSGYGVFTKKYRLSSLPCAWNADISKDNTPVANGWCKIGNYLYVSHYFSKTGISYIMKYIFKDATTAGVQVFQTNTKVNGLAYNGTKLYLAQMNNQILELDTSANYMSRVYTIDHVANGIAYNPENGHYYTCAEETVRELDEKFNTIREVNVFPYGDRNQIHQSITYYKGYFILPQSAPTTLVILDSDLNYIKNIAGTCYAGEIEEVFDNGNTLYAGVNTGNPLLNNERYSYYCGIDIMGEIVSNTMTAGLNVNPYLELYSGNIRVPNDTNDARIYLRDGLFPVNLENVVGNIKPIGSMLDYIIIKGYVGLDGGADRSTFVVTLSADEIYGTGEDMLTRVSWSRVYDTVNRVRHFSFGVHTSSSDNPWIDVQYAKCLEFQFDDEGTVVGKSYNTDTRIVSIHGIRKIGYGY